jgi:glycosyltransferase involved in cell wall biosynthesis
MRSIDLLIPCHNEADGAVALMTALNSTINEIKQPSSPGGGDIQFSLIIVDDGSTDGTSLKFKQLIVESQNLVGGQIISFSRNFGKEAALLAGLTHCHADACIIMDADLQDPPELIGPMIAAWLEGHEVVNAVRHDRSSDSLMKRISSRGFYSLFLRLSKLEVQFNASDFRLLDRVSMDAIIDCQERVRFSKGFFAWVGFRQKNIYFNRPARHSGASKWGSWKLWNYALDGILSFSTAPLRIWSYIGLFVTAGAFIVGVIAVIRVLFFGIDVPGYASTFFAVTFLGGLQLIGIGILGEYVGRSYLEAKRRPHYLIRSIARV